MSVLTYPPSSDDEILNICNKKCGIITATEDLSYFALGCSFCEEKFLYFDAFIGHMQTEHAVLATKGNFQDIFSGGLASGDEEDNALEEDLTETDPSLLEPQLVMIKEEIIDDDVQCDDSIISGLPIENEMADVSNTLINVKEEKPDVDVSMDMDDQDYFGESYGNYDDYTGDSLYDDDDNSFKDDEDVNYDDLVEESLLDDSNLTMHIKDRKMIQFLIDAYRRNPFLWDHRHMQFRDRGKRQNFLEWIIMEFKRRFNVSLARDAVTRKWDNLRTVYKRECNRMSLEKTNVSTLWYFKELHFLNKIYGGNQKLSDAVVKETIYRRRYSALWNDVSTTKLLSMVETYPCFYDKYHIDYRSKEKRGEALLAMVIELQDLVDVSTIQISKRISQLRFDYSKQKQERLQCEQTNKVFVPSYSYYDQMRFMDADVAPFKCKYCPMILQTPREMDLHLLTHQSSVSLYICPVCNIHCDDAEQLVKHKQTHKAAPVKEVKYFCDLCTASFREKSNYDEHMRRHNDELFLPSLLASTLGASVGSKSGKKSNKNLGGADKPYTCDICGRKFANLNYLNSHRALHKTAPSDTITGAGGGGGGGGGSGGDGARTGTKQQRSYKCDFPQCKKVFAARQSLIDHTRLHFNNQEEFKCDVCGKGFKSSKNLQNHKQIHDAIKRYVCKICGSAFAQAAGLYLHKRRHNRPNSRMRQSY